MVRTLTPFCCWQSCFLSCPEVSLLQFDSTTEFEFFPLVRAERWSVNRRRVLSVPLCVNLRGCVFFSQRGRAGEIYIRTTKKTTAPWRRPAGTPRLEQEGGGGGYRLSLMSLNKKGFSYVFYREGGSRALEAASVPTRGRGEGWRRGGCG